MAQTRAAYVQVFNTGSVGRAQQMPRAYASYPTNISRIQVLEQGVGPPVTSPRRQLIKTILKGITFAIAASLVACAHPDKRTAGTAANSRGLVLQADEGERMTRRWGLPMTIKIDPVNGGSRKFWPDWRFEFSKSHEALR